jgi:hypothetical protein
LNVVLFPTPKALSKLVFLIDQIFQKLIQTQGKECRRIDFNL